MGTNKKWVRLVALFIAGLMVITSLGYGLYLIW